MLDIGWGFIWKSFLHISRFILAVPSGIWHFRTRRWLEARNYPHFTLALQTLAALIVGIEALCNLNPEVFIDTMGYPMTMPLFKLVFLTLIFFQTIFFSFFVIMFLHRYDSLATCPVGFICKLLKAVRFGRCGVYHRMVSYILLKLVHQFEMSYTLASLFFILCPLSWLK